MRRVFLKELREHGWIFLAVFVLFALGLAVSLSRGDEEGGRFSALKDFLTTLGLVGALVAGNRLVVREYTGRTQLFLETLPISRERVVLAKWVVGWLWVNATGTLTWAATWWWQTRTAPVAPETALKALVPAVLWLSAVWSVCFVAGLLGRYRLLFWVAVGLLLQGLDSVGQVQLLELPGLHLVSESLAVAAEWPRTSDVVTSLLFASGGLGLGLLLASAGEGAIATTLSGRMTSRERLIAVSVALVAFLVFGALTRNREKPPFALEGATPKDSPVGPIGVLPGEDVSPEQATALVEAIAVDVVSFVQAMRYPRLPGVYVVSQRGLDPDVLMRVPLSEQDGIVFRANVGDERFDSLLLRYNILHAIVSDHTAHRALEEDRHWLLDGLTAAWNVRGDETARARLRTRAAASPIGLSERSVRRWNETFEGAGECFGMAISFVLVDALMDELGEAGVIEVARRVFVKPRRDVRDALFEETLARVLEEKGVDWPKLVERAEAARRNAGGPLGYEGRFELEQSPGGQTKVRLSLLQNGAPVTRWRGLVASVEPWQSGVADSEPTRVDARSGSIVMPTTFAPGERLFLAIDLDEPTLGCSARVFQSWQVVP